MARRSMATWPLLLAALGSLSGCGQRCPSFGEKRDDLPASASSGPLTIALRATRIGQTNGAPAVLSFWSSGFVHEAADDGTFGLTITDVDGNSVAHPVPTPAVYSDPFVTVRMQDERGTPLPPGLYRITLTDGPEREHRQVSARFEIVHCALYY